MAMKVESVDRSSSGLKVEGDLGDLQIIEDSSEDDGDVSECRKVSTLGNIPNGLVKASTAPIFGTVQITNSDNTQFGNNTYFNGPVTIKQVIQTNSGCDNAAYHKTEDENISNKIPQNKNDLVNLKFQIKTWHKVLCSAACVIVLASICAVVLVLQQKNDQSINVSDNPVSSNSHAQTQVMGNSEIAYTILLSVLFIAITYLLWVFCSLLTNGSGDAYCDGRGQKRDTLQLPSKTEYCGKQRADDLLIAPEHLRIVSRTDWLAQPVEEKIDAIRQPVPWVIITHTATEGCTTQSSCVLRVRIMQTFHIESRNWSDIGYNFMVGGDGSAYHGRGWDQIGAHTKGYNKYAISIAFIGTFNTETPPKQQIDACKKLIKLGVSLGKLAKDYKIFAHRQLMSTLSPGDKVFEIIKTWPHFYSDTDISAVLPKY